MKLHEYKKGDRVKVPHGTGTIVGFEAFYTKPGPMNGYSAPMTDEPNDSGDRAFVKLDPGHTWACAHWFKDGDDMLYGAWEKDLEKLPDTPLTNETG